MDEHRAEFLNIVVRCRDAEGHFYLVHQTYDLRAFDFGNIITRSWQLRREEVRFARFSPKPRSSYEEHPDTKKMELIGSQRLPRWRDWAK
jgi:hypothetical protein